MGLQIYCTIGLNQSIFTPYINLTHTFLTSDSTIYGNSLVMDIKTQRGRMHELNRIEAGTATITVNNTDGRFWRYNTASPYYPYFQPLTPIQLYCVYNSNVYYVFTGMIESIQPDWIEDVAGKTPVMKIGCVDLLKTLTRYNLYPSNVPAGGVNYNLVELSSARVSRVLNYIASTIPGLSGTWPSGLLNLQTGLVEVSPLTDTMIGTNGMNALQYLQTVADAESGKLYIAANGALTFENRDSAWNTFSTSQATFDTGLSGNIYIKPEISDDDTFIYNVSQINYNNLSSSTDYGYWQDLSYVSNQGTRLYQNLDGVIYQQQDAQDAAYIWTERYKQSVLRVKSLELDCDASPDALFPKALGYDLSTRITLNLNNTDNPSAIPNKQYQIQGINHDWQAWKNCWHTQWQLWDINQYQLVHNIMTNAGHIENDGVSYTTVHNAASGTAFNAGAGNSIGVGQTNAGGAEITRGLLVLDSSGISALPILSASLFLNLSTTGATTLCLVLHGTVNYPVVGTNYGDLLGQTAIMGSVTLSAGLTNSWVEIPLNALGVTAINVGGTTIFALRSADDINAVAPTNNQLISIAYAAGNAYWAIRFNL